MFSFLRDLLSKTRSFGRQIHWFLGGGFTYFLFSPLLGEDDPF